MEVGNLDGNWNIQATKWQRNCPDNESREANSGDNDEDSFRRKISDNSQLL